MGRSTSSSTRASGGTNPVTNYGVDTCLVLGGDGRKKVLTITWSYGANGAGIPAANLPLYGRLLVIAGVDASGYNNNLPIGVNADTGFGGIAGFGGRIVFDTDLQAANGAIGGQFVFPDTGNEGYVGTDSGALTIILTAPVTSTNTQVTNVIGKVSVQFDNSYASAPADGPPGYAYTPVSRSAQ